MRDVDGIWRHIVLHKKTSVPWPKKTCLSGQFGSTLAIPMKKKLAYICKRDASLANI